MLPRRIEKIAILRILQLWPLLIIISDVIAAVASSTARRQSPLLSKGERITFCKEVNTVNRGRASHRPLTLLSISEEIVYRLLL